MDEIYYSSVEELYKKLFQELDGYARKHLVEKDQSIDAVHEAFSYITEWKQKNPQKFLNPKIVYRLVERACRRMNRHINTVSLDDPIMAKYFRSKEIIDRDSEDLDPSTWF